MKLIRFKLHSPALCLGERVKKNTYRNSITTIPYTQISGALRAVLAADMAQAQQIHAVGIIERFQWTYQTYSLRDDATGVARVPLQVKALANVEGYVYLVENDFVRQALPAQSEFTVWMGAMKSRGLGRCRLSGRHPIEVDDADRPWGWLATRIPLYALPEFGIDLQTDVTKRLLGYLFQPDVEDVDGQRMYSLDKGQWAPALIEGSFLRAPEPFLEKPERRVR